MYICRGQKRAARVLWELKLQMFVNYRVGARDST